MFQWSSDKTLKIVAKMIAHPHDLSCHQILKHAATGFFSWQPGTGCSHGFPKHLQSSKLNQSLGAKRHCKLILSMSVTACAALDFPHKLCIVIFCQPALHTTPASQDDNWHNILQNILQISLSEVPKKKVYIYKIIFEILPYGSFSR